MPETTPADIRLHYEVSGQAGPWVVLSGSVLTDLHMWDAVVPVLAASFRVLRYDQRGHGASEAGDVELTFPLLADDLAGLMDRLDIRGATLVGASMGGTTALVLASRRPDLAAGVVVAGSRAASSPSSRTYWSEQLQSVQDDGMTQIAERTIERWFTRASAAADTEAVRATRATVARTSPRAYAAAARLLGDYDVTEEVRSVRCPVLLAYGDADPVPREAVDELRALLPQANVVTIPETGHLPAVENPRGFAEVVEDFLRTTTGTAR